MKTKFFKKVDFWARELRLPLFWLTDPKHEIFSEDVLVFYKNNVMHVYNLNKREAKAAEKGYKFFANKNNVIKYKKENKEIRSLIRQITRDYKKLKIYRLSLNGLKKKVFELIGFLDLYSSVYTKTEPFILSKIEASEKKYKKLIKELGELRFILRQEGEPLFYNLFGVFLKEVAKRSNLKVSDLFFYEFSELKELFSNQKVKKDIIEKRKKGYALICLKNTKRLLIGKNFKALYKDIVLSRPKTEHLSGQTAMAGKARGRVRVILHKKRNITNVVASFKKREILVTEMTRPDTVLACRKAVAIITDEGGITSHAAIISRELKIPCIIGTKIATQVLKDGDLVEVDANKGVVKIIKKG